MDGGGDEDGAHPLGNFQPAAGLKEADRAIGSAQRKEVGSLGMVKHPVRKALLQTCGHRVQNKHPKHTHTHEKKNQKKKENKERQGVNHARQKVGCLMNIAVILSGPLVLVPWHHLPMIRSASMLSLISALVYLHEARASAPVSKKQTANRVIRRSAGSEARRGGQGKHITGRPRLRTELGRCHAR